MIITEMANGACACTGIRQHFTHTHYKQDTKGQNLKYTLTSSCMKIKCTRISTTCKSYSELHGFEVTCQIEVFVQNDVWPCDLVGR